jgi:hypothetical protein
MKRKVYKSLICFGIIICSIALISVIVLPAIIWSKLPTTSMKVWIIDKTVPFPDYREHKGVMWELNHLKIINQFTGNYFSYNKDYYGTMPLKEGAYKINKIPNVKQNPSLIYITDTYGVYNDEYITPNLKNTSSNLIYGGLNSDELKSIKNNLGNGNTIIGEFNIASSPSNMENRKEFKEIFGMDWMGWKGMYYKDLTRDLEVPEKLIETYETQTKKIWNYKGEGFVLVSDKERVEILEIGKHVGNRGLRITFEDDYKEEFSIESDILFRNWFEFTKVKPGIESVANYKLDLTSDGIAFMKKLGLNGSFPAIIRNENLQYTSYYFGGDFSDLKEVLDVWGLYGVEKMKKFSSALNNNNSDYFYWNCYVPVIEKILKDVKDRNYIQKTPNSTNLNYNSIAEGKGFKVFKDGAWTELYIKGVNIGAALPGKWFTEFPEDEEVYLDWFEMIGKMNANSIRMYTLLPPAFYNALEYYNKTHPNGVIWLMQEIWPEENPKDHNYLIKEYVDSYFSEINNVIDAVHGKANIPERKGRAFGIYTKDVSKYVLGYLVGRELEPDEVLATNSKNKGFSYLGNYITSGKGASPTEAWLAMNCDYAVKYEAKKYQSQHPVGIVSWPTLDVAEHDSEWNVQGNKSLEYNDKVSVNINNIDLTSKMKSGFFGAYHIYPNYPDFMNNESKYDSYNDDEGRFRYGGYLKEFIENHTKYPALVAEFGLATGMGNAHTSPDGYNHGGLTEEEQGNGIVRMMKVIKKEGYAGGMIFEWMDEWAKKTWITEPYMIPYDRHVFWHNVIDPEQNYGILAMQPSKKIGKVYKSNSDAKINQMSINHDEDFLYIDFALNSRMDFETGKILLGLDTYDREKGEFKFDKKVQVDSKTGMEFLIDIQGIDNAKLLVIPSYNISKGKQATYISDKGIFEELSFMINSARITKSGQRIEPKFQNGSILNYGDFNENLFNHWYMENNTIHFRIPWGRLNFSDPSSMRIINDSKTILSPIRDELNTTISEGIMANVLIVDKKTNEIIGRIDSDLPYDWNSWTNIDYTYRLKKSYNIIKEYFSSID